MVDGVHVCLSFDFDAMSSWIAGFRTMSPNALSRGEFGRVGALRFLDLLKEYGIRSTWFVPGHTIEAFPAAAERIVAEGHEVGHHGYCHEDPRPLELADERSILERGIALIEGLTGVSPQGYRCPSGSFSENTLGLLVEYGFSYDSSMMADDFSPYYCRVGHQAPVDAPYVFGHEVDLVEVPFSWHKLGAGVYTLTMHPQVIGRGHRLLMLEKLIRHMRERDVSFTSMGEFVEKWRAGNLFSERKMETQHG